jgi:hypothetical protein
MQSQSACCGAASQARAVVVRERAIRQNGVGNLRRTQKTTQNVARMLWRGVT